MFEKRLLWALVPLVLVLVPAVALLRHRAGVARTDAEWRERRIPPLGDIGAVRRLEILPLLDLHAARRELATDVGVSYLVRADDTTVLFDTGNNSREEDPSPLEANLRTLGVSLSEVDVVLISHAHFDHVGGRRFTDGAVSGTTFGVGNGQPPLLGKRVLTPIPMSYPGLQPVVARDPVRIAPGVATTGTIARKLFGGFIDEQALAVHVANQGIVLIVGCGHQTLPRLLERAEAAFSARLFGVVGGLHYPVPEGRMLLGGVLDAQRRLGSGSGPLGPLTAADVDRELALLSARGVGLVSIGGHDSSDEVIERARALFGSAYRDLRVGEPIVLTGE